MMFVKDSSGKVLVNLENMDDVYLWPLGTKVSASKGEANYQLFEGSVEDCKVFFDGLCMKLGVNVPRETGGVPESPA